MRRAEIWIVSLATAAVLIAAVPALRSAPDPLLDDHDMPHYAAVLAAADDGVSFARDPIFAGRAGLVWRAAVGYMALFKTAYVAAGGHFGTAVVLLQLLLLALYFPSMVGFLRSLGATLSAAIGVAAVSSVSSAFLVTGTRWGVLTPPVPLVVCTALAPLVALAAIRWTPRLPVLAATALCAPLLLVNPATGLALVELALILALIAAMRGALTWKAFAALVITAAVWTVAARLNIGAGSASYSFADAAEMIRYGQDNVMVYPFRGASASRLIGAAIALHAVLSAVLFFLRSRRGALIALIAVQALTAAFFLRAGWLALLPLAAAIDDLRRDRLAGADRWLWCALGIAIAIGPLQQLVLLALWQQMKITGLTPLVFEGARFLQFSYLFLFALLARAVSRFHPAAVAVLCAVAYLNLDLSPLSPYAGPLAVAAVSLAWVTRSLWLPWFGGGEGVDRARAAVALLFGAGVAAVFVLALFLLDVVSFRVPLAAGVCAAMTVFVLGEARHDWRGFAAACALAALVGGPWMLLLLREPVRSRSGRRHDSLAFALKLPRAERNAPPAPPPCESDLGRMIAAVRAGTPPGALFHVATFDRRFRALAGRSMLPVSDEWLIPIYDGAPVGALRRETAALWEARSDPAATRRVAAQFGADYVVTCDGPAYTVAPAR